MDEKTTTIGQKQRSEWFAKLFAGAAFLGCVLGGTEASAQTFTYSARDLLLGFRQPGATTELLVNIGTSTNYSMAKPGSVIEISQYTTAQLRNAFSTLDGLYFSAFAGVKVADGGDTSIPATTLWATRARLDGNNTQSEPWLRKSTFSQGGAANRITSLGNGGIILASRVPADALANTPTVILEPAGDVQSYGFWVTDRGNLNGTFQGSAEAFVGDTFAQNVRADLYELRPGAGDLPGTYLGYFELRTDGSMFFKAAGGDTPSEIVPSVIQSLSRDITVSKISFSTMNDATVTYRLCFTNSTGLATPVSQWPVCIGEVKGDGQIHTLEDTSVDDDRFYSITATR